MSEFHANIENDAITDHIGKSRIEAKEMKFSKTMTGNESMQAYFIGNQNFNVNQNIHNNYIEQQNFIYNNSMINTNQGYNTFNQNEAKQNNYSNINQMNQGYNTFNQNEAKQNNY